MLNKIVSSAFLFVFYQTMYAQCSSSFEVVSSHGYTVHIDIQVLTIVPSSNNCPWGYNYNVQFNYDVSFSGVNIPSSLWTLQGHLPCGSNESNFYDLPNNGGEGTATSVGNIWRSQSDCASATPMSLGCENVRITIQGPGINNGQVLNMEKPCNLSNNALPVELSSFNAQATHEYVNLSWTTASELNNSHFEVLKSYDGSNWSVLGRVQGVGTSTLTNSYNYIDKEQSTHTLVYYRLRQVDFDGAFSFSEILSVEVEPLTISLSPNPAKEYCTISSSSEISSESIQVLDFTGRAIPVKELIEPVQDKVIRLMTSRMLPGIYLLSVNGAVERLVVE